MNQKSKLNHLFLSLLAVVSLTLFLNQSCKADPSQDPPPETSEESLLNAQHREMLRGKKYALLDKEMSQIQQEFEQGRRSDISLLHLFRAFYDTDLSLRDHYAQWIKQFPRSYAAHEAQGVYFRRVGYQARGEKYARDTSAEQFAEMARYFELAVQSHEEAIKLSQRPLLSYYSLLSIAKINGDTEAAKRMFAQALKIAPANFIARYKYMLMLEGRWGGSLAQMKAFRIESQKAGIPESLLQYLDELIADEVKWLQHQ